MKVNIKISTLICVVIFAVLTVTVGSFLPCVRAMAADKREKYIICIDPGHQIRANLSKEANDPGSKTMKTKVSGGTHGTTTGIPEYKLTLVIGKKLRKELKSRGYKVVMTRTKNDVDISNKERAEYATKKNADITIRLHADGAASSEANGASVLCPSSKNPYIASLYKKSKKLSTSVIDSYCNKTGMKNRGIIYSDTMTGLNWSTMPVTLIEMGFMTNPSDDKNMQKKSFQKKMVAGIADGIDEYFGIKN